MTQVAVLRFHMASSADVVTTARMSPDNVSLAAWDIRAAEQIAYLVNSKIIM